MPKAGESNASRARIGRENFVGWSVLMMRWGGAAGDSRPFTDFFGLLGCTGLVCALSLPLYGALALGVMAGLASLRYSLIVCAILVPTLWMIWLIFVSMSGDSVLAALVPHRGIRRMIETALLMGSLRIVTGLLVNENTGAWIVAAVGVLLYFPVVGFFASRAESEEMRDS